MINKFGMLTMLLIGSLALTVGCSGEKPFAEPPPVSEPQPASTGFLVLPPPSQIKFDSEVESSRLRQGLDFETSLPNALISEYIPGYLDFEGIARYDSNWEEDGEPAYAMYRLASELDWNNTIHSMWSSKDWLAIQSNYFSITWMGIADFGSDSWKWAEVVFDYQRADNAYFGNAVFPAGQYERDGQILVVAVTIDHNSLCWLLAGEEQPPVIISVSPDLVMTGSVTTFTAELHAEVATSWSWDLGEGVIPRLSTQVQPLVAAQAPGDYAGVVTVNNNSGSYVYEFDYQITEVSEYEPQHLYAIPEETTVQVGEELVVTVVTGALPDFKPLSSCIVGLLVPAHVEYVRNSANMGTPGGGASDIDGIWAGADPLPTDFLLQPDGLIKLDETGIPGLARLDYACSPFGWPRTSNSGEIFNLKLVFNEPGEYHLSFQGFYNIYRTFYESPGGSRHIPWYDISNSIIPAITVLP